MNNTPATIILSSRPSSRHRKQIWQYRSDVGYLSYIQAMVCPASTMAVQQCACFCENPGQDYEEAVKHICSYLLKTKDKGLILRPDKTKGLECHVDVE